MNLRKYFLFYLKAFMAIMVCAFVYHKVDSEFLSDTVSIWKFLIISTVVSVMSVIVYHHLNDGWKNNK